MKKLKICFFAVFLFLIAGCGRQTEGNLSIPERTGQKDQTEQTQDGQVQKQTDDDWTAEQVEDMTLEEKVGQMFLVRCPDEGAEEAIGEYQFGGYLLFAQDFENQTPDTIRQKLKGYQAQCKTPMLIAVDEEGGTVNRISRFSAFRDESFLSPRSLYTEGGLKQIQKDTEEKCELLNNLGISVNLAPVCDVTQDTKAFMYDRAFGGNGEETAEYVKTVVGTMVGHHIAPVLKHFPGYGDNGDTHTEVVRDDRSYETYQTSDFLPFQAGMEGGAECILVCHNIVDCMDSRHPASLSPEVHRILREELGFQGVIMTDDLSMAAITKYGEGKETAVQAVLAGNDLLCCTDYKTQIPAVLTAVKDGTISECRIDASVKRILQWKKDMGLLE